jgi:hypothetical protein
VFEDRKFESIPGCRSSPGSLPTCRTTQPARDPSARPHRQAMESADRELAHGAAYERANRDHERPMKRTKRVAFGLVNFRHHRVSSLLCAERPDQDLLATIPKRPIPHAPFDGARATPPHHPRKLGSPWQRSGSGLSSLMLCITVLVTTPSASWQILPLHTAYEHSPPSGQANARDGGVETQFPRPLKGLLRRGHVRGEVSSEAQTKRHPTEDCFKNWKHRETSIGSCHCCFRFCNGNYSDKRTSITNGGDCGLGEAQASG